jgi:hypothetical protein
MVAGSSLPGKRLFILIRCNSGFSNIAFEIIGHRQDSLNEQYSVISGDRLMNTGKLS